MTTLWVGFWLLLLGISLGLMLASAVVPRLLRTLALRVLPPDVVPIRKPQVKFDGFDPSLRERTAERRVIADKAKRRAAQIDSGEPVQTLLRSVK
jgi:hypothetical protein